MCSDWGFISAAWLLAAIVSSFAVIVGARSSFLDGEQSLVTRRVSMLLCVGTLAPFAIGLARGVAAVIRASAKPGAPHGVELFAIMSGRSRSMNILTVLFGIAAAALLVLIRRRPAGERRSPVLGLVAIAAISGLLNIRLMREKKAELCESLDVVRAIQGAQEDYRAEMGTYANVSTALAANQATNHVSLYPSSPHEPGSRRWRWNAPCPASACNAGSDWSRLPVRVDGPVAFGYSSIAGHAGERPAAMVRIDGVPVQWPVPEKDWYIVTAVGDPTNSGEYVTVVASSFTSHLLIDVGGR